ncbi:MAG: bifunctional diguanylate cyclase/phosphodiesterase [Nitriliruptoraceae bacterium]
MRDRAGLYAVLCVPIAAYATLPSHLNSYFAASATYMTSAAIAVAVTLIAIHRQAPERKRSWTFIAGGLASWVLGDAVYDVDRFGALALSDVFYTVGYAAFAFAVVELLRAQHAGRDTDNRIEAAMVSTASLVGVWLFVIEPHLQLPGATMSDRLIAGLYPTLSALLLFLLMRVVLTGRQNTSAMLLTAAIVFGLVSDTAYAFIQQAGAYDQLEHVMLDAGWLAMYALIAAAAVHPSMRMLGVSLPEQPSFGTGKLYVAVGSLAAIPMMFVLAAVVDLQPSAASILVAGAAIVPLVLWRFVRLHRELERTHSELVSQERYYRLLALHASDVFIVINDRGSVIDASASATSMLDQPVSSLIGKPFDQLLAEADRNAGISLLDTVIDAASAFAAQELRFERGDGTYVWAEVRLTNLLHEPDVAGVVANVHNITARKHAELELEHLALHDPLTGLANRALLRDRIAHGLMRRERIGTDVAVIFCDLDGFKHINDSLGHAAGDDLLREVAKLLASVTRPDDTVARLGGDEFAVLLEGYDELERHAIGTAERVREVLSAPIHVGELDVVITASLGITIASLDGGINADDLLRDADTAMYAAKAAGRDHVMRYSPSMQRMSISRVELASDLRRALEDGEFVLHFQPIHEIASGQLVGMEALVRWRHTTRGLLLPWRFIPLAEQTGMIVELGHWVIEQACRAAARWPTRDNGEALNLSINLSPRQLRSPELIPDIAQIVESTGLDATRLVLELTETALVSQPEAAATTLHEAKELGIRLAIDDFGAGFSSLNYLRQFPADILKIDRSYIGTIDSPRDVPALVRGFLELGRTLQLETVAEGIETTTQLHALTREGCRLGQGFLFAKALDQHEVDTLLASAPST